jgi:hypothetical protein
MASDSGSGKLGDYRYNLVPANKRVTIRLADSDPYQEELASLLDEETLQSFIAAMSGVVGFVPRGLEPAVIEALTRLEGRSDNRIPATIIKKSGKLRVVLLMGNTR